MHGMLGLIAAGSNGQTLDQLLSFLKANTVDEVKSRVSKLLSLMADGSSSGGPRLSFVNSVWIEQTLSLKSSFKQVAETVYKAAGKQVNFRYKAVEVKQEVNSWAEKQTSGLIKEIVPLNPVVDGLTRLILANAVYFKGAWKAKFEPSMTKDSDFHLPNGGKVKVPFMTSNDKQLVGEYDGVKVSGLPYSQGGDKRSFSMYMFLPNEKESIPSLIEKLGSESSFLERHIPRKQVKVNEEGTEAAAATARVFEDSLTTDRPVNFVADHPFLFVIREDVSGEVMFMGQVVNPSIH
ncbi:serine protease inhibitor family protein [Tanacetum coccineum]